MRLEAILTINNLPEMDHDARARLSAWLRSKAVEIKSADPSKYAARYRSRLFAYQPRTRRNSGDNPMAKAAKAAKGGKSATPPAKKSSAPVKKGR